MSEQEGPCRECGVSRDAHYLTKVEHRFRASYVVCFCAASTARDGHIHEKGGHVLCLHYEEEDGSDCPQARGA